MGDPFTDRQMGLAPIEMGLIGRWRLTHLPEDTPSKQAYKAVTENQEKQKGGRNLT